MKNETITTKQFNLMANHIVSILSSEKPACSYRFLIYNVMGLDETYYSYLYPAGQDLTNTLAEVTETLKEIEQLKAKIEKLKTKINNKDRWISLMRNTYPKKAKQIDVEMQAINKLLSSVGLENK